MSALSIGEASAVQRKRPFVTRRAFPWARPTGPFSPETNLVFGYYVPSSCRSDTANAVTTSSSTPSSSRGPFSSPCSSSSPSLPSSLLPWLPPVGIENVRFRPSLRREPHPTPQPPRHGV